MRWSLIHLLLPSVEIYTKCALGAAKNDSEWRAYNGRICCPSLLLSLQVVPRCTMDAQILLWKTKRWKMTWANTLLLGGFYTQKSSRPINIIKIRPISWHFNVLVLNVVDVQNLSFQSNLSLAGWILRSINGFDVSVWAKSTGLGDVISFGPVWYALNGGLTYKCLSISLHPSNILFCSFVTD